MEKSIFSNMATRQNQQLIERLKAVIVRQTEIIDENKETIKVLRQELVSVKKELLKLKNISTSKSRMIRKRASVKKDVDYDSGESPNDSDDSEESSDSSDSNASEVNDWYDYCSVTGKMFKSE